MTDEEKIKQLKKFFAGIEIGWAALVVTDIEGFETKVPDFCLFRLKEVIEPELARILEELTNSCESE